MKKNSIRGYIVLAICFVVFSVIAFAAPFNKANAVFWMAYVFAVIAMASQIYIFRVSFSGENVKSKFYGFPIARIGVIYLITQVVLSLFEMILGGIIPAWVVIILNIIIAAVAAIGCITTEGIKEEIERQDVVLKANVSAMRELQSLSAALAGQASGDVQHSKTNDVVYEWTTDGTATRFEGFLEAGKEYILRETKAPAGHTVAADVVFTVSNDGNEDTVNMYDTPTTVSIRKVAK